MKNLILAMLFSIYALVLSAQTDDIGSGRAISLDGVDDYIDLGNIYDDLTLPVTISAWIYTETVATQLSPIFVSQDNAPLYNGFWFAVTPSNVFIEYGDGFGENNPAYRRGISAPGGEIMGRWVHVCGIMRSSNDMDLFVNGIDVGGSITGGTNKPMSSAFPSDVAKIGYLRTNGVTHHFKGIIDEIRIWNRSLTPTEIRTTMCRKLNGDEQGLIGYWNFDEVSGNIVSDKSQNGYDGELKGNPTRIFSGAPIGDKSTFLYPTNWTNQSLSLIDNSNELIVSNVRGNPNGVQVYMVDNLPSQTQGLDVGDLTKPYFGVFLADLDNNNIFDAEYLFNNNPGCDLFIREDNSTPLWNATSTLKDVEERTEVIKTSEEGELTVALGDDQVLCDQVSAVLNSGITDGNVPVLWNTGETSAAITVGHSGDYWVEVSGECGTIKDTVNISFQDPPAPFSLGDEEALCAPEKRIEPLSDPSGYEFTWQDGSHQPFYEIADYGLHWVTVSNACGSETDSVLFSSIPPLELDLGNDHVVCDQFPVLLNTGGAGNNLPILWSTGETAEAIQVQQSGSYWAKITGLCGIESDTVNVLFMTPPATFSLGSDEVLCGIPPKKLQPLSNPDGYIFTWHDGSHEPFFDVVEYGVHWVTISNICGSETDSVLFSKVTLSSFIPNVITPNNDAYNDYFIVDESLQGLVSLQVFNRWGKSVYTAESYENNWDGTGLAAGTYFYRITGACIDEKKGAISILR